MTLTRRTLLRRSALAAAAFATPLGAPFIARAADPSKVSLGGMSNGWSLMAMRCSTKCLGIKRDLAAPTSITGARAI